MGLRRQLLLFGSLSLALPWAGFQYVKEMETALRHGQSMALEATAQAVSARLESDPALLEALRPTFSAQDSLDAIYAHPVQVPLPVDGYDDDWRNLDYQWQLPLALGQFVQPPTMQVARRDDTLHLLVRVADSTRDYFDPATNVAFVDRIELLLPASTDTAKPYLRLYASAPGPLVAEALHVDSWQRDHRLRGIWNEREGGYVVEVTMPFELAKEGMAVAVIDGHRPADWPAGRQVRPVETRSDMLDNVLQPFAPEGVRLYLVKRAGWIAAKAGALASPGEEAGFESLQRYWIRRLVGQAEFPSLESAQRRGAFALAEVRSGFDDEPTASWYFAGDRLVGRALHPVEGAEGGALAVVVAEQATDSLDQLTSGAIGRLLLYSIAASLLAAVGLLGFASVLSYRVRRLSLQAQRAVDRDGRIAGVFRGSRRSDEIGELSRQYSGLLERLHNYTQYLETLASKLSHELRTPLAIVKSSLDNLSHVPLSQEAQTYVARAAGGSERLSAILNAMSAAARLEQSIHSSEKELVDLREMLPLVVSAYNDLYRPTPITLTVSGEHEARALIAPELFVQMLDKLVDNAVDFSEADTPVEVHLHCGPRSLTVQVTNRGAAIPEPMLDSIFDSLVSVRGSQTGAEHLGLGLYVVRLIATFHQAQLRAVNLYDEGKVRFEIVLPLH